MKKIIAFDARMASHPGIGRYIRSLLSEMVKSDKYTFRLIGDPQILASYKAHAKIIACDFPIYRLKEQLCISKYYRGADIVHVPHFNIPFKIGVPLVVTIHDLIHFQFKEYEPFPGALFLLRQQINRVSKLASKVIVVSEATKKACAEMFPSLEQKTQIIYEAADDSLSIDDVYPKALNNHRYILSVGSIREHKNIHGLLKAFELILLQDPEIRLVILGKLDKRFEAKHRFVNQLSKEPRIIHIDNASDKELVQYYQHAQCLVAASFIEGFGLPVVESMKCGTPCVVSENTSLAEVAGDSSLTFNPNNPEDIANKTLRLLSDEGLRAQMGKSGLKRADEFSWKKSAEETMALYDEVLK